MARDSKPAYYQEPLFDELRRDICYVCCERIKKDDGIYIGNKLWRHRKCKPGGRRWQKSRVGRSHQTEKLFSSETS